MHACRLWVALCTAAALVWSAPTRAGEPNWPDHLAIATASPGGTYYVYGEAVARILSRSLNLPTIRLATEGPAQNIEMLEAGEAKLGFVTMGIALQAWNATGAWTGKKPARSLRAIFPMYDTPFHFARAPRLRDPCGRGGRRQARRCRAARRDLGRLLPGILQDIEN